MKEEGHGRYIDTSIASLQGEGAQQVSGEVEARSLQAYEVWERRSAAAAEGPAPTYYDRPTIKEPVWIWAVPAYFYAGGAAGAASVLGEVAEALGDEEVAGLVKRARWIGAIGGALGTGLLVYDLGRPERFLNMLRVFRPTSPMSVGTWILAAASPSFAASALLPHSGGVPGTLGNAVGKLSAALGLPLSGYTAVLLSGTAVPLWQQSRRSLPLLFTTSAASSAASLLQLTNLNHTEQRIVARFGLLGEIGELAAGLAVEREAARVERVGKPLHDGPSGSLWRASKALTCASVALSIVPGKSRLKRFAAAVMGTAGSLAVRFAVFEAGRASARDPRATFEQQRAGHGAAEVTATPARPSP